MCFRHLSVPFRSFSGTFCDRQPGHFQVLINQSANFGKKRAMRRHGKGGFVHPEKGRKVTMQIRLWYRTTVAFLVTFCACLTACVPAPQNDRFADNISSVEPAAGGRPVTLQKLANGLLIY